ncbi:MAG: Rqc2 family fibronectin-binding protein [Turicibacter sp.]
MSFDGLMTHCVSTQLKEQLVGGRINKIYQLSNHEILMQIRAQGKNQKLLISTHSTYARIQLTHQDYQYPDEPPMFCMFLRKHIDGGIIYNVEQINDDRIIKFTIRHINELGDQSIKFIYVEIMGKHSNIVLTDPTHRILDTIKHVSPLLNRYRSLQPGASYILPPPQTKEDASLVTFERFNELICDDMRYDKQLVQAFKGFSPLIAKEIVYRSDSDSLKDLYNSVKNVMDEIKTKPNPHVILGAKEFFYMIPLHHIEGELLPLKTLSQMFDRYYFGKDERDRIKQQFQDIERFIRQEYDKNVKKMLKLEEDLDNSEKADEYKIKGELIFANLHKITRGQKFVVAQNFYSENLEDLTISLEPNLSPSDNAQKYFQRYNKAKNAVKYILEQMEITEREIAYFETLLIQMETANFKDATEMKEELESTGYLRKRQSKKRKSNGKPNIEKYLSPDQVEIFIGKNNLQNDYLTHKFARRNEWWFHAKDMPGSHVLVRSEDLELSEATIRCAAQLASYYSKGRQSSSVPVDYTRVRQVKKIPAAHLGFVTYEHQKTIYIDPDEGYIMNLTKLK